VCIQNERNKVVEMECAQKERGELVIAQSLHNESPDKFEIEVLTGFRARSHIHIYDHFNDEPPC